MPFAIEQTPEARRAIDNLIEFMDSIRRPNPLINGRVGDAVRQGFASNFLLQRSGDGRPWAPLSPFTILQRQKLGYGARPILVRSGDYRRSFTLGNHPEHHSEVTRTRDGWIQEEGSDDERVPDLEGGTARIPARPVTILSRRSEDDIGDTLDRLLSRREPD